MTANRNQLSVELQPGLALIHVDALRLRQVLGIALVSNAAKFTAHGNVQLRASTRERQPGVLEVRFDVEDTGIGLSPAEIGKLFQPFLQADEGTTRAFGGSGLGLAISRRLCRLMGGDIEGRQYARRGLLLQRQAAPAGPLATARDAARRRTQATAGGRSIGAQGMTDPAHHARWRDRSHRVRRRARQPAALLALV